MKDEIYRLAEKLKKDMEYLGISQSMAASVLGVTPRTVGNYLNGSTADEKNMRKLQRYLRSEEFFKGYSFIHRDNFSELFSQLWIKFRERMTSDELCEKLNIRLSEVNHLRNNSKSFDVRKQYEVLEAFYKLCIDYTGEYFEGFESTALELYSILGYDFSHRILINFAEFLSEVIEKYKFPIDFLAKKSEVPAEDIDDMIKFGDSNYDAWKKCDILDVVRKECLKLGSEDSKNLYNDIDSALLYYDKRKVIEGEYYEKKVAEKIKQFKSLPAEDQAAVLSHTTVFFDLPVYSNGDSWTYDTCFWDYISTHRLPTELFPEADQEDFCFALDDYVFFRRITDLFRELDDEFKEDILSQLDNECHVPICGRDARENLCFEYVAECFDMSRSIMQKRSHSGASDTVTKWMWGYFNIEKMQYLLTLDEKEWRLHALLYMAVCNFVDLNPYIHCMLKMVEFLDYLNLV